MKQKNIFIAAAALLILVFAGAAFLYQQQQAEAAAQRAQQNLAALVRTDASSFLTRPVAPAASSIRWSRR